MPKIITDTDPTLEAIDKAIAYAALLKEKPRRYVGMSSVGEECKRKLWYRFRWATPETFDAKSLKRFEDGHTQEDVQANRLRLVHGITLLTHDPDTGDQIGFRDLAGHFCGHCDGNILGILQAPKTWHIWEHKSVEEKALVELEKLKRTYGDKEALKHWKPVYYAQAILYMYYAGMTRHYLTVSSPGGRRTVSCRTNCDTAEALVLIEKAKRIIEAQNPPEKISKSADYFECRWCSFHSICHGENIPQKNCRTCLHSTPLMSEPDGAWACARYGAMLEDEKQREGCGSHLFIPSFVPGRVVNATEEQVTYELNDGSFYTNRTEN